MANEEHVKILKQGVVTWNAWREANPEVVPDLKNANLQEASLRHTDLRGANFVHADLRGVDVSGSRWGGANIGRTKLDGIGFETGHLGMYDGTDHLVLTGWDRFLSWSRIRLIGRFPLFSVSWSSLAISVLLINIIGFLNTAAAAGTPVFEAMSYPIPIPRRMMGILVGSILLVIGSTLYRVSCPVRVQEFSETTWVEEHGHPRLQYLAKSLSRRPLQAVTAASTIVGGVLALILVGERFLQAVGYILGALASGG